MVEQAGVNSEKTKQFIDSKWDDWYVKGLSDFIRVPNLTPMVDAEYLTNGHVEAAYKCVDEYIDQLELKGVTKHKFQPEGSVPLYVYVVDATGGSN